MRRTAALLLTAAVALAIMPVVMGFGGVSYQGNETATFNENTDGLPPGCDAIEGERTVEVAAVSGGPGYPLFEYEPATIEAGTCTRLTVSFSSRTRVRHQFVVRNLPAETYPGGYFGIEADSNAEESATLVTPPEPTTLPVESTVGKQARSGLRGQIKVGGGDGDGDGDAPGIPGVTKEGWEDDGQTRSSPFGFPEVVASLGGLLAGVSGAALARRYRNGG